MHTISFAGIVRNLKKTLVCFWLKTIRLNKLLKYSILCEIKCFQSNVIVTQAYKTNFSKNAHTEYRL